MPDQPDKIQKVLAEEAPQILHFFCHGVSNAGVQNLEFATINDWDLANPSGSSLLSIDRLVLLPELRRCWLTVLNCCEGAGAVDQAIPWPTGSWSTGDAPPPWA